MRSGKFFLPAILICFCGPYVTAAHGDDITLRDGKQVSGNVVAEDDDRVTVDTPAGLVVLWKREILQRTRATPELTPEEQKQIHRQITRYTIRMRAILQTFLDDPQKRKKDAVFAEGRQRLMDIDDPLAIGPVTRVLGKGGVRTRLLLVEWLGRFNDDEATANLIATVLLDPDAEVRSTATAALAGESDPRIARSLVAALCSDDEEVIRNAASAIGTLEIGEAAGELVTLLSATGKRRRRVSRVELLHGIGQSYVAGLRFRAARGVAQAEPIIGVAGAGTAIASGQRRTRTITETVTVYRTEVQEALIKITGRNFGFDEQKWSEWLAAHPPQVRPNK